jgi:diguanylate cyclase (GGDEF)-like protein
MNKKHILIIEDSPTQARYNAFILEDAGYQTSIAVTGQQGIEMSKETNFDTILLDVILPDMDGYKVCNMLRQVTGSYVPILMLTAQKLSIEDKVDGLTAGADDYLSKPFDPRELLARVSAMLRVKQLINDLLTNLTNEHQAYQSLRRIALTDHLTKLYNRHYFTEALHREFSLAQRHKLPLACIMTDIDHFRDFNNHYGHTTGDIILEGAAKLMQDNLREDDIIARYGGEEFIILLTMTDLDMAVVMAERIRTLIENYIWKYQCEDLKITISFGVAALPSPVITQAEQLIQYADKALYKAKAEGRNRVASFDYTKDMDVMTL